MNTQESVVGVVEGVGSAEWREGAEWGQGVGDGGRQGVGKRCGVEVTLRVSGGKKGSWSSRSCHCEN